ncbi:hypothetical protein [Nonomuraea typhae]|nr:hypothetical protein [Nonomuraea typhae]
MSARGRDHPRAALQPSVYNGVASADALSTFFNRTLRKQAGTW